MFETIKNAKKQHKENVRMKQTFLKDLLIELKILMEKT